MYGTPANPGTHNWRRAQRLFYTNKGDGKGDPWQGGGKGDPWQGGGQGWQGGWKGHGGCKGDPWQGGGRGQGGWW